MGQHSFIHVSVALNFPVLLHSRKKVQWCILAEKQKSFHQFVLQFILSLISTLLHVTNTHLLAKSDLSHLTEDQSKRTGDLTVFGGDRVVLCGWLNVKVAIFNSHFL